MLPFWGKTNSFNRMPKSTKSNQPSFFIIFNLYQLPKYSVQVSTYPDNLTKRMKYTPDTSKTRVTLSTRSDLKNIISLVCYISELSRVVAPYRGRRYFITTLVSLHCQVEYEQHINSCFMATHRGAQAALQFSGGFHLKISNFDIYSVISWEFVERTLLHRDLQCSIRMQELNISSQGLLFSLYILSF